MASNIKKNLGFQTLYQLLTTCFPLITAPYLSRVLGATELGIFSYTSSIVAYFMLFAMLGTINYGTRSIASVKSSKETRSKVFWEIYSLQLIVSLISIILYFIYLIFFCRENKLIALLQIISLFGCMIDVSWLFFGLENFKLTVTRSIVIRVFTVVGILLFVKTPNDLWLYTLLMLGGTLVSQIILWIYVPKNIVFLRVSLKSIVRHIKPNIILFVPLLAMSVYHTMDKTMLGLLSNYEQSGFYYNADKIINIPLGIINGVGTVMLPRMTSLYYSGNQEEGNRLFILSIEGVTVVSVAMAFGIAAVSKEFVPFFFGSGYDPCVILTIVLAPVLILKGYSNTARIQYLVPLKMEKVFTKSVFAGAITNLFFNLILIPKLGAMGAVIGTLTAELVSCIWQFIYMQKSIDLKACFKYCISYFIAGTCMFVIVRIFSLITLPILLKLVFEIIVGGFVFISFCIIFWKNTNNRMYKLFFGNYISRIPVLKKFL